MNISIYMSICIYIYAPSNGWCWNPKGLLNDSLSHPFGTPWRVQVYDLVWISCGEVVKREACRKNDACISLYLLYICSYHPSKQTASNRNSARSHGQEGVKQRHQSTTGAFLMQEVVLVLRSCFVRILCYILLVLYFSLAQKPAKQLIL